MPCRKPVADLTLLERKAEIDGYLAQFHDDAPEMVDVDGSYIPRIPAEALALTREERTCEVRAWFHPAEAWIASVASRSDCRPAPLPESPTSIPPGEQDKVELLRRRALKRQRLFHPQDRRGVRKRGAKMLTLVADPPTLLSDKDLADLRKIRAVAARITHGLQVVRPEEEGGAA